MTVGDDDGILLGVDGVLLGRMPICLGTTMDYCLDKKSGCCLETSIEIVNDKNNNNTTPINFKTQYSESSIIPAVCLQPIFAGDNLMSTFINYYLCYFIANTDFMNSNLENEAYSIEQKKNYVEEYKNFHLKIQIMTEELLVLENMPQVYTLKKSPQI
jgi:hypothetical protein